MASTSAATKSRQSKQMPFWFPSSKASGQVKDVAFFKYIFLRVQNNIFLVENVIIKKKLDPRTHSGAVQNIPSPEDWLTQVPLTGWIGEFECVED